MKARIIRRSGTMVHEDAFGTPPAARGSMMCVAGETDDLEPGEELLVDDEVLEDASETMDGPLYPEGVIRVRLGALRKMISQRIER